VAWVGTDVTRHIGHKMTSKHDTVPVSNIPQLSWQTKAVAGSGHVVADYCACEVLDHL